MLTDAEENPDHCKIRKTSFTLRQSPRIHTVMQNTEKTHQRHQCKTLITRKYTEHSEEKARLGDRSNFRKKTAKKLFKCDQCNKAFKRSDILARYLRINNAFLTKIKKKLDRTLCRLKQKSKKLKRLEKTLFKEKNPFKPVRIKTPDGTRYLCTLCEFTSRSWGKCCAHIAQVHNKTKQKCNFCKFSTFNPDSFNRHRKKHD